VSPISHISAHTAVRTPDESSPRATESRFRRRCLPPVSGRCYTPHDWALFIQKFGAWTRTGDPPH